LRPHSAARRLKHTPRGKRTPITEGNRELKQYTMSKQISSLLTEVEGVRLLREVAVA
jgi:hypothetical protein